MLEGAEDKLGNGPCGFVIRSWASPRAYLCLNYSTRKHHLSYRDKREISQVPAKCWGSPEQGSLKRTGHTLKMTIPTAHTEKICTRSHRGTVE